MKSITMHGNMNVKLDELVGIIFRTIYNVSE